MNSNVTILSADEQTLFVSNQFSATITTLAAASDGSLSLRDLADGAHAVRDGAQHRRRPALRRYGGRAARPRRRSP